ncbi:c-type cytochrome [Novosphingobium sp.]|uniref:c-type cytochrome n=1 Tax=Novosphingobium sp. TaxID=1874826 RepID=UPI003BA94B2E
MKIAFGLAAMLSITMGSAAHASDPPPPRAPDAIYAKTCGYCHGHNVGPVIRGRSLPAEAIEMIVRHGQGAMPAFKPTEISPAELSALAKWISASKADSKEHGQ